MNEAQQKAWDCLTKMEQQSLFLHTSEGKSSWEAGSMLKISHYKYIEIRERSEKFFRLFGDYFTKWPSLFRPDCPCERNFQDFIEGVIEHRMKRREAMVYTGDSTQQLPKVSNENIERNMKLLKVTEEYLAPIREAGVDTLVLGCTHYPLLTGAISYVMGDSVTLVSSAEETAKDVYRTLNSENLMRTSTGSPTYRFQSTGDAKSFEKLARRFLGPEVVKVENI